MKATRVYYLVYIGWLIGLCSCSHTLDKQQYIEWVHDYANQLHVSKEVGDYVYDVQFTPAAYIWLQRANQDANAVKNIEQIDSVQYYTLTIGVKSNADFIDYQVQDMVEKQRKLYYFSYLFQNDIQLEQNGRQFPCILFHFERPVDLKASRTFVLGFVNPDREVKEARLIIQSDLLHSVPIKIKISKSNIPILNL